MWGHYYQPNKNKNDQKTIIWMIVCQKIGQSRWHGQIPRKIWVLKMTQIEIENLNTGKNIESVIKKLPIK